jgi:PST family polysaccharide transporter
MEDDLKKRAVRGGLAKLCAQATNFVLRVTFIATLARLLSPEDFGLVGMVTIFTGFTSILTHAWLSSGSVQQATIDERQLSTLFWVYAAFGVVLCAVCFVAAPAIASLYNEPRLFSVTVVLGVGCLFATAGVQHYAILQRQLRYVAIALIEAISLFASIAVGVAMALAGYGYWALVGATVALPASSTVGLWLATQWIPGLPHRNADIGSTLRFGGLITFNILVVYVAYNVDKVLIGWFWGPEALGIYGRAYQLAMIPSENINAAIGGVAFAALSRLQDDPIRFKTFFLNGYALVSSIAFPITILSALYASDIVDIVLGAQWSGTADILRLLTPAILVLGIINPLGWLMFSAGLVGRSTRTSLVIAPLVVTAYAIGISFGPSGVALAFSIAMTFWFVPHAMWCVRNTTITLNDLVQVAIRPFIAAAGAGILAYGSQLYWLGPFSPFVRLLIGAGVMVTAYVGLLIVMPGQKQLYGKLLGGSKAPAQAVIRSRVRVWLNAS